MINIAYAIVFQRKITCNNGIANNCLGDIGNALKYCLTLESCEYLRLLTGAGEGTAEEFFPRPPPPRLPKGPTRVPKMAIREPIASYMYVRTYHYIMIFLAHMRIIKNLQQYKTSKRYRTPQ